MPNNKVKPSEEPVAGEKVKGVHEIAQKPAIPSSSEASEDNDIQEEISDNMSVFKKLDYLITSIKMDIFNTKSTRIPSTGSISELAKRMGTVTKDELMVRLQRLQENLKFINDKF